VELAAGRIAGRRTKGRAALFAGDPLVLSAAAVVGLLAALAYRGPITRAIGTANDFKPLAPSGPMFPMRSAVDVGTTLPLATHYVAPRALHAARDPFVPLDGSAPASASVSYPRTPGTGHHSYVVRSGDSLWRIAERELGSDPTVAAVDRQWRRIYAINAAAIGSDPSRLLVGTRLVLS
jgi:nucleoid-associated protein YgaU